MCECRRSDDEYQRLTEPARSRNERHQAAAQHQHALAMQQWQRDYDLALMEWNAGQVIHLFDHTHSWHLMFHAYIASVFALPGGTHYQVSCCILSFLTQSF